MARKDHITNEFELIDTMIRPFKSMNHQIIVPNGDDAAIYLPSKEKGQVVCVDTMVEDVHFSKKTLSNQQLGYKALAVNLSDLAAMGATPQYFLISIAVPPHWSASDLEEIYAGMSELAEAYDMSLLGGDTVSISSHLVITVTVMGEVAQEVRLLRSNAKAGDVVFISNFAGDSAAGLHLLLNQTEGLQTESRFQRLLTAHQRPVPHVEQGKLFALSAHHRRIALNDISDGIASEAHELASSSQVSITLERSRIPLSEEILSYAQLTNHEPIEWALYGGEDYCLIGTAPPEVFDQLKSQFLQSGLQLFEIGLVEQGNGEVYLSEDGSKTLLEKKGYNHFRV
jgi:thiamine-monophosphate kinase